METAKRTLIKTLSWRFWATIITMLTAWALTGNWKAGLSIGLVDTIIKFFAYYIHERAWTKVNHGYNTHKHDGAAS